MLRAAASSQRELDRSGPPASMPTACSSSCTGLRAAYRNGIAITNHTSADNAALPGTIIQNEESAATGHPFRTTARWAATLRALARATALHPALFRCNRRFERECQWVQPARLHALT